MRDIAESAAPGADAGVADILGAAFADCDTTPDRGEIHHIDWYEHGCATDLSTSSTVSPTPSVKGGSRRIQAGYSCVRMAAKRTLAEKLAPFPAGAQLVDEVSALRSELTALDLTEDGALQRRARTLELLGVLESALSTTKVVLLSNMLIDTLRASVAAVRGHIAYIGPPQEPTHYENQLVALTELVRPLTGGSGTERIPAMAGAAAAAVLASKEIAEVVEELRAERDTLKREIDQMRAERLELLQSVTESVDDLIDHADTDFASARDTARTAFESDRRAFVEAAEQSVEAGEGYLDQLKTLLGVAGDLTLSSGYGAEADKEANTSTRLRTGSLVAGLAAVFAGVGAVVLQSIAAAKEWDGYDALDVLPAKLTVIGGLAAIAGYLGRQAANHRRYSEHLRGVQLELQNLGPYLAQLDITQQATIRGNLVSNFFGRPVPAIGDDAPTAAASVDQLLQLIKELAQSASKLPPALGP